MDHTSGRKCDDNFFCKAFIIYNFDLYKKAVILKKLQYT